ncbi:MAG: lytic transglycosylase domain-containing protein [Nitrospirae bacterium]|nr:lytic transglycosylase domain-containing protein [Nitrospirota bacterium]
MTAGFVSWDMLRKLKKTIIAALPAAVCIAFCAAADADIYKFIDANGIVYYTDVPKNSNYVRLFKAPPKKTEHPDTKPPAKTASTGSMDKPAAAAAVAGKPKAAVQPARPAPTGNNAVKQATNFKGYEEIAHLKAAEHNIDPSLLKAVIKAESNWNSDALSPKGAMGLMQLMPGTANLLSVNNPYDPAENIDGGARYLKYLLAKFNGNVSLALAGYNAGPNAVDRYGAIPPYAETQEYVAKVMSTYNGGDYQPYCPRSYSQGASQSLDSHIFRVPMPDGTVLYTNTPQYVNKQLSGRF